MGALWWPVRKASSIWHSSSLWGRVLSSLLLSKFIKIGLFAWMFYSQDWSSLTAHILIDYSCSSMLQSIWLLVEMNMLFSPWSLWMKAVKLSLFSPPPVHTSKNLPKVKWSKQNVPTIDLHCLFVFKERFAKRCQNSVWKGTLLKTCFHSCGFLFERAESNEGI